MTEINYNSPAEIKVFLEKNKLQINKKFGQNFLLNPSVRHALVSALEAKAGESVWEIGPGIGAMTGLLLEKGLLVRAFEIDYGYINILSELFCNKENLTLIKGDVLKTWQQQPPSNYLLGNLPYNIAATLLADLIINRCFFKRMVVTVQREVALRMRAVAGSADYSSFSLICASAYNVKPLMLIKSGSFYPKPNVDSQGVLLELKDEQPNLPSCFFPLVKSLFSTRRKTIKNNLSVFLSLNTGLVSEVLKHCNLDGNLRAEELSFDDFKRLAATIENM